MFKNRAYDPELIDDHSVSGEALKQNLRELHVINSLLGGYDINFDGLKLYLRQYGNSSDPLKIVDLGCGGGDNLKVIANYLRKKGVKSSLTGVDINHSILDYARENCTSFPEINFQHGNALGELKFKESPDIIFLTLFLHHFNEEQVAIILENLLSTGVKLIVINDLHRNFLAYYSIKLLTALFSKSYLVKNDAPLSVRRGFLKKELNKILQGISASSYKISWKWAFRWKVLIFGKTD